MQYVKKIIICIFVVSILLTLILPRDIHATQTGSPQTFLLKKFDAPIKAIFVNGSSVLIGTDSGLYYTDDNFKNVQDVSKGVLKEGITSIDFINGEYYIGTNGGGLYKGTLSSNNWTSLKNIIDCPTISCIKHEGNNIYVTSYCSGFFVSFDNGMHFSKISKGLSSYKAQVFVATNEGYYLGTDEALYFSKDISQQMSWVRVLDNVNVTSLGKYGDNLIVGTSNGFYKGYQNRYEKIKVFGENPYIEDINIFENRIAMVVRSLGIVLSCDGIDYFTCESELPFDINVTSFNSYRKVLYLGTKSGNLYSIDLTVPILLVHNTISLGTIKQKGSYSFSINVYDFSFSNDEVVISLPSFARAEKAIKGLKTTFNIVLDLTKLLPQTYSIPISIKKSTVEERVFVNFSILKDTSVIILLKIGSKDVYVNGELYKLDAAPFIDKKSGRTLVPIRFISEALNLIVTYNEKEKEVIIQNPSKTLGIQLYVGKEVAFINGKSIKLDTAPVIVPPGRTFVPLRFVSEAFGGSVFWDSSKQEIKIVF